MKRIFQAVLIFASMCLLGSCGTQEPSTEFMKAVVDIEFWVTFLSRIITIGAGGIAIYVFVKNKDRISTAVDLLINFSYRITLNELSNKLERLNEFIATSQKEELINLLSDIEGQLSGNKRLRDELPELLEKIKDYIANPAKLTEPKKRSLVSELRERIRDLDVTSHKNVAKKK